MEKRFRNKIIIIIIINSKNVITYLAYNILLA